MVKAIKINEGDLDRFCNRYLEAWGAQVKAGDASISFSMNPNFF
ncbi:hypothetical protein Z949_1746 [Sulfitobacter guttiformis KCTC 32187]|nr:hypothetical protein Z949_1746 [Sulfitobacter guttiformis KCTC 32187]